MIKPGAIKQAYRSGKIPQWWPLKLKNWIETKRTERKACKSKKKKHRRGPKRIRKIDQGWGEGKELERMKPGELRDEKWYVGQHRDLDRELRERIEREE